MYMLKRPEWMKLHLPMAQKVTEGTGIFPEIALAQAVLESSAKFADGYYYPGASRLAQDGNNFFGIKATGSWKGDTIILPTIEYSNGKKVTVNATFRKYANIEESFKDYINFLKTNPRYKKAGVFSAKTYQQQAAALQKAGYATDPKYSSLLTGIIDKFKKIMPIIKTPFLAIAAGLFFFTGYCQPKKNVSNEY